MCWRRCRYCRPSIARSGDAALAAFYQRWRNDDLVLDKWFAIQAMSPLPDTVNEVRALARHPDFDLKVPNRVRALVSSFASGNQVRFHDASGGGYRFLADIIMQLDPTNGQVAARMVSPLGQWRRVDAARQEPDEAGIAAYSGCCRAEQGDIRDGVAEFGLAMEV